jgi:2-oxoglutarate ferredoxin oxidoreductase subunit alpha
MTSMSANNDPITETQTKIIPDVAVRLAGYSQDGIQAVGSFMAQLAGRMQLNVMTFMTIPSTIAGGDSVYQVRMGSGPVLSVGDELDVLVAFYQDSFNAQRNLLKKGGILIYDSEQVTLPEDLQECKALGIPLGKSTEAAIGGPGKGKNIYILGVLTRLLSLDVEKLRVLLEQRFGGKSPVVLKNVLQAFECGYAHEMISVTGGLLQMVPHEVGTVHQITMDGNQSMAYGLLTAGVRYGASYPITPATSIMEILRKELPHFGGIFLQTEDELAAICAAVGMSYGGNLAVTTTSGPGMSLKMEALSYATMAEIPLLVVNVQRGGPSTGIPTQVEQSDLMQAIWGSHGDNPRVVLAAKTVEDCYYCAIEGARIARKYSTPVIILSDQILSTRIVAFREPDVDALWVDPTLDLSDREASFKPYDLNKITRHAIPGTKMLGGKYPTVTGLEHDEDGKPNPGPKNHMLQVAKRREKIKLVATEAVSPAEEVFGASSGKTLLIGWGSTFGPIREVATILRAKGQDISHYHLRYVNPLPQGITEFLEGYEQIFVIEMNDQGLYGYGQLASHLRSVTCNARIQSITKTDGLTFRVSEIINGLNR